ncbi:MAG TPA: YwqJ-related putative deaminase [Rugosimonospora sp.]|nr:YwqJ-related putative deaminase [Rugosimonospora sp.]
MIDEWGARLIAAAWLNQDQPVGAQRAYGQHEFDLGYVFWRVLPLGEARDVGAGRSVVDRDSGEQTYWPSVPAEAVADMYRQYRRAHPVAPLTWDPLVQARHDHTRAPYPSRVTHLRLAGGQLRMARTMKGDGSPNPHPVVRDFLAGLPVTQRERGYDRCSELAALSDAMHAEDAGRAARGEPPMTLAEVRERVLRGAELVTYRIREPADPLGGQPAPPCLSCQALLRHCGFALQAPTEEAE